MNKKAQIPTVLLVVVALALALAALFTFAKFDSNISSSSKDFSTLSTNIIFADKYINAQTKLAMKNTIQNCQSCSTSELAEKFRDGINSRDYRVEGVGNFFGKLRTNEFQITQTPAGYQIKIENLFLQSEVGANKIRRDFSLCMTFDNSGNFIGNCALE